MMRFHRHPSFFPIILLLLTFVLGGWMYVAFRTPPATAPVVADVVSEAGYRAGLRAALAPVITPTGGDRAAAVAHALAAVLAERVPADDLSIHLAFALALSRLSDGLKGDAVALREGQTQFDAAVAANPWVR